MINTDDKTFWNRVKGNLHGHDYILRESRQRLLERADLNDIVLIKKTDSTIQVYNKTTKKQSIYQLEYTAGGPLLAPVGKPIGTKFDLTFEQIYADPNLTIEADLPIINMINYTIKFDTQQTNKIKQALEKNKNITITWNILNISFTKK